MNQRTRKYLFDILTAGELITRYCNGRTWEDYQADSMLRDAVERRFEIIGEATGQMLADDPNVGDHMPEARQVVAFRNRLIHGYAEVDDERVWQVVVEFLPQLIARTRTLLEE
jgi:uncharacterized protein with HEPN domain